jgi:hypothetical protein
VSTRSERPVTIAVTGAHSTGKSTFLARLAHRLRRQHLRVATIADLGEQAQRAGLPVLYHHTWASTLWVITRGISNEVHAWHHADIVLIDRPVPDALAYYRAALDYRQESPIQRRLAQLECLVKLHSEHYDLIFRTTLDHTRPLGRNKPRDTNTKYRLLADRHVRNTLTDLELPHQLLTSNNHHAAIDHSLALIDQRLTTRTPTRQGDHNALHRLPSRS